MQYPRVIVVEMIKQYTKQILNHNNDDENLLYTSKAEIEHKKGELLCHEDIINDLLNKKIVKQWEITKYPTTNHTSKDGFKCYELIQNMNDWDSILVILPPNPSKKQKDEWVKFKEMIE